MHVKLMYTQQNISYDAGSTCSSAMAPTVDDAENCFITKPIANQKLLNEISKIMKMKNM
jgi:hypothetical protein